ncbi:MAG: sarcosine oxidase subunit gamma family protein [Rhodospirillales bacterium]
MPEFQRQGPLDGYSLQQRAVEALGEAGVGLGEIRYDGALNLRARRDDPAARKALAAALGMPLPETTGLETKDAQVLLGLGPDEWLLLCPEAQSTEDRLRSELADYFVALTDVSDNFVTLVLTGPRVRDLLSKGVPLDLHDRSFPPKSCAQTLLSKAEVLLYRGSGEAAERFTLLCRPSFAQYVFTWLEDAAQEYGLAILAL